MPNTPQNTTYDTGTTSTNSYSASLPGVMKALSNYKTNNNSNVGASSVTAPSTYKYTGQALPAISNKVIGETQGTPTEAIPSNYSSFIGYDPSTHSDAPTETTVARNWPSALGGGQYALDTANPMSDIKSARMDSNAVKEAMRAGLSSYTTQIDHVQPLWSGGLDTLANKQVLTAEENWNKQKAHSIPIALLTAGKINLDQAKLMAYEYQQLDPSILSQVKMTNGSVSLTDAEKYQKIFDNAVNNPEPVTFSSVIKQIPQELSNFFGKEGPIAKASNFFGIGSESTEGLRRFGKGFVEGVTGPLAITGVNTASESKPESASAGWEGDLNNNYILPGLEGVGNVLGSIVSFTGLSKLLGLTKNAILGTKLGSIVKTTQSVTPLVESTEWAAKTADQIAAEQAAAQSIPGKIAGAGAKIAKAASKIGTTLSEQGLKIPAVSDTTANWLKLKQAMVGGAQWAAYGQLTLKQETDFKDRIASFITDGLTGGIMTTTGHGLGSYAKSIAALTTIGTMGKVAAGDQDPIAHAFENALMLTAMHSVGNPALSEITVKLGGEKATTEVTPIKEGETTGVENAPITENKSAMKIPDTLRGNNIKLDEFNKAVDDVANQTAKTYLKNIAPNATAIAEAKGELTPNRTSQQIEQVNLENAPKKGISKMVSAIKSKIAGTKTPTVDTTVTTPEAPQLTPSQAIEQRISQETEKKGIKGLTTVKSETLGAIAKEALNNIYTKEAAGTMTPSERDLAIKQTYVAIRQIEKGGMAEVQRRVADAKDATSLVQNLSKNTMIKGYGTSVTSKLNEMATNKDGTYIFSPKTLEGTPQSGDFITGVGAITGAEVNPTVSKANQIFEEHVKTGTAELWLVKTPKEQIQGQTDKLNQSPEITAGHKKPYDANSFVEAVGRVWDKSGKNSTYLHLGWVSTEYRYDGPKVDVKSLPEGVVKNTLLKNQEQAFNNHDAVKKGFYEAYDSTFNNETIARAMDTLNVDAMKVDIMPHGEVTGAPSFQTAKGFQHVRFQISDANWKDIIENNKRYETAQNIPKANITPGSKPLDEENTQNVVKAVQNNDILPKPTQNTPESTNIKPVEAPVSSQMTVPTSQEETPLKLTQTDQGLPSTGISEAEKEIMRKKGIPEAIIAKAKPKSAITTVDYRKPEIKEIIPKIEPIKETPKVEPVKAPEVKKISDYQTKKTEGLRKAQGLQEKINNFVKKATDEGRELTPEERKAVKNMDKKSSSILGKFQALRLNVNGPKENVSQNIKNTYSDSLVSEGRDIIDNYTPRTIGDEKSLAKEYYNAALGKIPQKPRDMTTIDYKKMIDGYKEQMKNYSNDLAKNKLKGNEFMEPEGADKVVTNRSHGSNDISRMLDAGLISKGRTAEMKNSAGKEITRITYPEGEKAYKTEEIYNKGEKTEKIDKETQKKIDTKNAKDIKTWVDKMVSSNIEHTKGLGERLDQGFKEIFGDNYENNYYFQKIVDPSNKYGLMSRLFAGTNTQGYSMSQPKEYLKTRMTGSEADVKKSIEGITEQRKNDALIRESSPLEIPKTLKGYLDRVKDSGQDEGMVHDIIGLESKLPGLIKEEITGQKATKADGLKDGTRLLVDFSKEYNQMLTKGGDRPVYFDAKKYENIDKKELAKENTPKTGIEGLKERLANKIKSSINLLEEKYKNINTVSELSTKFDEIRQNSIDNNRELNDTEIAERDYLRNKIKDLIKK